MGPRTATTATSVTANPVRGVSQYKYATGVRNTQQHVNAQPQVTVQQVHLQPYKNEDVRPVFWMIDVSVSAPQPAVVVQGQEPLTTTMLAAAPLHEQKQMLGKGPLFSQHASHLPLVKCTSLNRLLFCCPNVHLVLSFHAQASVYFPSSRPCTWALQERSPACCLRSTTLSFSTCSSRRSRSAQRWVLQVEADILF